MAVKGSDITLTVNVDKAPVDNLEKQVQKLATKEVKLNISGSSRAAVKAANEELGSLIQTLETEIKTEGRIKLAVEKTKQARADARKQAAQGAIEELKNERQAEVTRQKELTTLAKIAQAYAKKTAAIEKTKQEQIKLQKQQEKLTKSSANMVASMLKARAVSFVVQTITAQFREALNTIREVDKELATIRKVTGFTKEQMQPIAQSAYSTASKYGVEANKYLESVAEFARAGYKEASDALGELAIKTQLVGDTSAEVADQFLLSVDAAWQMGGSVQALTKVLDEANIVENNYATSIEKLAEGMPNVASVAAMAGVSVEETIAALGTITAVTQQSGKKASTALRSLFLNIIGDTNTAFENETGEFVKWTENEVDVLRGLLKKYAGDVVQTAEATGTLVNPMKAIEALATAFDEGKLKASELEATLQQIGGKLRTNQLVALVTNFNKVRDMLELMRSSAGSADDEIEVMLDTWDSKAKILRNTWTEFVSKTISADVFKKILDFLTRVIKSVGDLGTTLKIIIPLVVAFNFKKIVAGLGDISGKLSQLFTTLKTGITAMSLAQIAAFALAAAISAVTFANQKEAQQMRERAQATAEAADASDAEAQQVLTLYARYREASQALDSGIGTKQAYEAATRNLAEALGLEAGEAENATDKLVALSAEEARKALTDRQNAIAAAENEILALSERWRVGGGLSIYDILGLDSTLDRKEILDNIRLFVENARKQLSSKDVEVGSSDYDFWSAVVKDYAPLLEGLETQERSLAEAEQLYGDILSGNVKIAEDGTIITEENTEAVKNSIEAYKGLTNSVKDANSALNAFDEEVKTELDDALTRYTNVYSGFLKDWEDGLVGSNKVKAAERLFFTDDQLLEMRRAGIDAGEMLANDFYQSLFAGLDEDGKQVNDHGLSFVNALLNTFGGEIRTQSGDMAAAIAETDDGIRIMVEDVDLLSQALAEQGYFVSPEIIAANLQALGMFTDGLDETVEGLMNIAAGFNAVDDGVVNLSTLIENALKGGNTVQEVMELADALLEAGAAGAIELNVDTSDIDAATAYALELIAEFKAQEDEVEENSPEVDMSINPEIYEEIDNVSAALDEATRDRTVNVTVNTSGIPVDSNASGTRNYAGGLSIVNEQGPELIAEGNRLRIAGGGKPTLTYLEPGATVLNAGQTRSTLSGLDPSLFFGGIRAFALGTNISTATMMADNGSSNYSRNTNANQKIIESLKRAAKQATSATTKSNGSGGGANINLSKLGGTASRKTSSSGGSSSGSSGGSSGGGGGSSSSSSKTDAQLEKLKEIVNLRKSELDLIEAQGGTTKAQIEKQRQIQDALKNEINYLVSIGGNQTEINKLWTEWYKINDDIKKLIEDMFDDLSDAASREIDALEKERDKALEPLDAQLKAMQEQRDAAQDQLDYEEKLLAVEEARQALQNAMAERTVRYWNSAKGQWEWTYDANKVASAQQSYDDAVKALADYEDQMAYDAAVKEIEAQKQAITDSYKAATDGWQEVIDALKEPTDDMETVLKRISESSMPEMEETINTLNALLARFGYAIGGYGGAYLNESMVPTSITSAMMAPVSGSFAGTTGSVAYGATPYGFAGSAGTSIGTQYNGGVYNIGGVSLTEAQAKSTTVYELAMLSRNLKAYNATC